MTAPAAIRQLPAPIVPGQPLTALAPMQDVTALPFMEVIGHYGPPDYFFTEYFRVHGHSTLEPHILAAITENTTGRPVFAQLIGESLPHLERTVRDLQRYPIAGIDLNMGCPAPKVYKKNVGGGLLRDPARIGEILGLLRSICPGLFTVKTRIGFDSAEHFETLLNLINEHEVDLLSLHGRTVKEMYRSEVHYDFIKHAAETVRCPVLANGNITSPAKALAVIRETGVAGVMIGRSAIRNPWIFRQIRETLVGAEPFHPTLGDVRDYIGRLYDALDHDSFDELRLVSRMKKFLNFVGQGVDPDGAFLHDMRRTRTRDDLFSVCDRHLVQAGRDALPFAGEPYDRVIARPNCETPLETTCQL